jgi:anti-sigma B factor antagonist
VVLFIEQSPSGYVITRVRRIAYRPTYICADKLQSAVGGMVEEIRHTIWMTVSPVRADMLERRMAELRFSMETHDACAVVAVQGELDVVSSQRFDDCLSEASASRDRVILDLSGVDFMDTTALSVVVGHWRRQAEAGGMLLLAGARYRYTKALWITGLADRLPMYDNVGEALAAALPEPGAEAASDGAGESGEPDAAVR